MTPLDLVTIPNVVMLEVGTWSASSGPFEATPQMLVDAVDAYNDPGFVAPRGKIGDDKVHGPSRKAVGRFENLRLSDNGLQVIGDHVCVPRDFARNAPAEYPNRSMEGGRNRTSPVTGKTYSMVISAMELLGVDAPACTTLPDLTPEQVSAGMDIAASALVTGSIITTLPSEIRASISDEDIRSAFYSQLTTEQQDAGWWVKELFLDPPKLIVDNGSDDGTMLEFSYRALDGVGVAFGTPQRVMPTYLPIAATASRSAQVHVYATSSESRAPNHNQEDSMDPKAIRTALKLAEDATDEQVLEAATKAGAVATTEPVVEPVVEAPTTEPVVEPIAATAKPEEGTVTMSAAVLDELKAQAALGAQAQATLETQKRDTVITSALREGRIAAAEKPHFEAKWAANPAGTELLLTAAPADGGLAKGLIPVTAIGVNGGDDIAASDDQMLAEWDTTFPGAKTSEGTA